LVQVIAVVAELTREDWHRLNGLLARALELDVLERARWLRELPPAEIDLVPLLERLLREATQRESSDFSLPASLLESLHGVFTEIETKAKKVQKLVVGRMGP
jgi:hypothetical protein